MRLDKWLANGGGGSRKEVKQILKKGRVQVNGIVEKNPSRQVDPSKDVVLLDGEAQNYQEYVYFMMNKPEGVITATEDSRHQTVLDLVHSENQVKGLYPVGRLDKDTEGLLLLTNDGLLGHRLLSPKHHVEKIYEAIINAPISEEIIQRFLQGIELVGEGRTRSAKLRVIETSEQPRVEIVITEGKFHQIKRMFHAVEREVLFLKRIKMGSLVLDEKLESGSYRPLTEEELTSLLKAKE